MVLFACLFIGLIFWVASIRTNANILAGGDSADPVSESVSSNISGLFAVLIIVCVLIFIIIPIYLFNEFDWGSKYIALKTGESPLGITPTSATFTNVSGDIDSFGSTFGVDAY